MPDMNFEVEKAEVVSFAVAPILGFKLRISNANREEPIRTVALRCQIMIEPTRRHYGQPEHERLLDLFGEPERWGQTMRSLLWTNVSLTVPPFTGSTVVDLQVPCTFDFNVAATKYFAGLDEGEIPLNFMFSGTVFYEGESGALQVAQISWDKEARHRLPVKLWKGMMDIYYPNSAWLCLQRDVFNRLYQLKVRRGIPSWEQTLETLLSVVDENGTEGEEQDEGETVH